MAAATPLITAADLQAALGPQLFLAVFDDDNVGDLTIVSAEPQVGLMLRRAHARAMSWLPVIYEKIPDGTDPTVSDLLVDAELLYAQAMSVERHPEYAKTYGEMGRIKSWETQADALMRQIVGAIRRITDNPPEAKPRNVGGIVYDSGQRVFIDGSDGTRNSGDF